MKYEIIKFISEADKIHNSFYDYSLVVFGDYKSKIKIICPKHGIFEQLPRLHLKGQKCKQCALKQRAEKKKLTKETFIQKSEEKHGKLYDYSKVIYTKAIEPVIIICKIHGEFHQKPSEHMAGSGCKHCGVLKTKNKLSDNTQTFIYKATKKHKGKYDYSKVDYNGNKVKICIICPKHGEFFQTPSNHLKFQCPYCGRESTTEYAKNNPTGWTISDWLNSATKSKNFDSFKVYILKCWNDSENFIKIGRTFRKVSKRFASKLPYNFEILEEFIFETAKEAYNKETTLKQQHRHLKYNPKIIFGGSTECFTNYLKN